MNILVVGGSSDIGQAIVANCLRQNHHVVFTVTRESSLEKVEEKIRTQAEWLKFNLDAPELSFEEIANSFPEGIDAVILNAASRTGRYRLLHEFSEDETQLILNSNVLGYTRLLQFLLRDMAKRKKGKIVLISSLAVNGFYKHSLYGSWKSYLEGMIKAIAIDYGQLGICANIVRPALIETQKTAPFWKRTSYRKVMLPLIPSGKFGAPENVAVAVGYFLEESCFSNGSVLEVTGGLPQIRSDALFPQIF